ncbi:hypothetical protein CDAR_8251 [Caerostris darwini]|uniref:Uncharacterized protein n=1 Tax=Caerostris darwini TaxID=1538125 RepID=A0AAV4MNJ4_9ARAC|nr:hypothetical protein CDAR_8251 [Caerostris darwini]
MLVSQRPRKPHFPLIASLPRQLPTGIGLRCRVNSRPLTEKSTLCLLSVRTREDFPDDSSPKFVSTDIWVQNTLCYPSNYEESRFISS